jgi:hypothetical protein
MSAAVGAPTPAQSSNRELSFIGGGPQSAKAFAGDHAGARSSGQSFVKPTASASRR